MKYRIQAELISRRDLSELSPVVDLLLSDSLSGEQRQSFLLIVINDVKNPKALPMIRRLSRSRNPLTRRAAAEGLWHIGDTDDISDLGRILHDSDEEVRFYAVRTLSDIANEPGWGGPGESEFREHELYLTHWQNWADTRPKASQTEQDKKGTKEYEAQAWGACGPSLFVLILGKVPKSSVL